MLLWLETTCSVGILERLIRLDLRQELAELISLDLV